MLTSTGMRKMVVFSYMYLKIYNYFGVNHLVLCLCYIPYYLKKTRELFCSYFRLCNTNGSKRTSPGNTESLELNNCIFIVAKARTILYIKVFFISIISITNRSK